MPIDMLDVTSGLVGIDLLHRKGLSDLIGARVIRLDHHRGTQPGLTAHDRISAVANGILLILPDLDSPLLGKEPQFLARKRGENRLGEFFRDVDVHMVFGLLLICIVTNW